MMRLHATTFGVAVHLGHAVVLRSATRSQNMEFLSSVASSQAHEVLEAFVDSALKHDSVGLDVQSTLQTISGGMEVATAARIASRKPDALPADVYSMVQILQTGAQPGSAKTFDEASMDKGRVVLNTLIEKAWVELDDKIFQCKGAEDAFKDTYIQIRNDMSRIVEQVTDLERMESAAVQGIADRDIEIRKVEEFVKEQTIMYMKEHAINSVDLAVKQNDLNVFQFIMEQTKCANVLPKTFLQTEDDRSFAQAEVCEMHTGRRTFRFHDGDASESYRKLLTPHSKKMVDQILQSIEPSFLQQPAATAGVPVEPVVGEEGRACMTGSGQAPGMANSPNTGQGMGDEDECMKSCGPICVGTDCPCGTLHDKMSLMWGGYKDLVDALTMQMLQEEMVFEELKETSNLQISLLVAAKAKYSQLLSETRSNLAGDRQELMEKTKQSLKVDREMAAYMHTCRTRVREIMYDEMCAYKTIRNAMLENSKTCQAAKIQDCDMGPWTHGECSVSCDDSCDNTGDPRLIFTCGGWKTLTRDTVFLNDTCGIKCPVSSKALKCNQQKCPINCEMSEWSGWSKCSAECEGGVESQTRSILVKPKNGGVGCNTVEDTRSCNTQSCDRDCTLQAWTGWTPCTTGCGGGTQEAFRHVLIPTRGEGKCPLEFSAMRRKVQGCNKQNCNGDEICIAKQDVVMGIDASGSFTPDSFKVLITFAKALLTRYEFKYRGENAVSLGLMQFGNGEIAADGKSVTPALNIQPLGTAKDVIMTSLTNLVHYKGFTNMAQAFGMAEAMFMKGMRRDASQGVLMITDGKPSFTYMTNEMVEQLDDKHIYRYFVVVNSDGPNSDTMKMIKKWASFPLGRGPWESNLVDVPGIMMLEADTSLWVQQSLTKFCPLAVSLTTIKKTEQTYGFMHVKDSGTCGDRGALLSTQVANAAQCAALTVGAKMQTFHLGAFFRRGFCYAGSMTPTATEIGVWKTDAGRVAPACASGWKSSMLYDFYAIFNAPAGATAPPAATATAPPAATAAPTR